MGRGKGDEVTDEADGKCQVAIQLGCDLGSRARWGKGSHTAHHSELIPGGMERVQERTGTLLCQDTTTAS